jgi:hypothetical protein
MKLNKIEKQLPTEQVKINLPGKLKVDLDSYGAYYEHSHGEAINIRTLIVEIVRDFVQSDREFQAWTKRHSNGAGDANGSPAHTSTR